MCNHENREAAMVVLDPKTWCDPCLAPLIKALNDGGIRTTSSCCGHHHRPGSVSLADGRWLMIAPNDEWMDWLSSRIYERVGNMPGHEPIVSAEDRADEGVRLTVDERRSINGALDGIACDYGTAADLHAAVERILAARLAEVEHELESERDARDLWHDNWTREKARADALAERGTERVEWGVWTVTERDAWVNSEGTRELAVRRRDHLIDWLTVKDGPNGFANGQRFVGAHLVQRTVTTFDPIVSDWEPVDDDRARGLDGAS